MLDPAAAGQHDNTLAPFYNLLTTTYNPMYYFPLGIVKVSGESMLPTFKPGQFLLVSPLSYFFRKPKVGDIVVVQTPERRIIKRIKKVSDRGYFIVGDNDKTSTDSRQFGSVTLPMIQARVL